MGLSSLGFDPATHSSPETCLSALGPAAPGPVSQRAPSGGPSRTPLPLAWRRNSLQGGPRPC
eukprot:374900-Pyramimonas_sp.AAC.1